MTANARVRPGSVRVLSGEELVTWFVPPDGFHKAFCSACGSALFSRPPSGREPTGVRLGAFDGDPGVRPQHRQFVAYAAVWEPIPDDGLPRYPGAQARLAPTSQATASRAMRSAPRGRRRTRGSGPL